MTSTGSCLERSPLTNRDQHNADRRTGREGRVERENTGREGDRAERHQNLDRENADVAGSKRLQLFGLLRCELALPHHPRDIENDLNIP
jgi:hypothetical protein